MLLPQLIGPMLRGTAATLQVFALTLVISLPLSFLLSGVQYFASRRVRFVFDLYITLERGTPLLLQMMFIFFGLPYLGITLDRNTSILLAFVLNYTAYLMEILRGGILAVDSGQKEAAQVLGYSKGASFAAIILPQAIVSCLPAITNEVLNLIKDTSLITVLGAGELLKAGRTAVNTYATALPFIYVAIIYLLLTFLISWIMKWMERKLDWGRKNPIC